MYVAGLERSEEHTSELQHAKISTPSLHDALPILALLARDVDVGQEVHLDLDLPVAAAHLAAAALDVEREAPGLVAARPRLLRLREQLADLVEQPDVRRRIGEIGRAHV